MDAAKALQYYRIYALLISDGVGGAAPAISAAARARGAEAAMVADVVLNSDTTSFLCGKLLASCFGTSYSLTT